MAVFIAVCSVAVTGMLIGEFCKYVEGRYGKRVSSVVYAAVYVLFTIEFFEFILRQNM